MSVRHRVHEIVDTEAIRVGRRRVTVQPLRRPLPVVADVVVPVGNSHHAAGRPIVIEQSEELRRDSTQHRVRNVERPQAEKGLEDRMAHVEADEIVIRQHDLHLRDEVAPFPVPIEVVEDDESALQQILAQIRRLRFIGRPAAGLGQVDDRILEDARVIEVEDVRAVQREEIRCRGACRVNALNLDA